MARKPREELVPPEKRATRTYLRALRRKLNLTQERFAERTGITKSKVGVVELGRREMNLVEIGAVVKKLGLTRPSQRLEFFDALINFKE